MSLVARQLVSKCAMVLSSAMVLLASGAALAGSAAQSDEAQRWGLNMTESVTAVGQEIYDLHMLIFWICVWIGVAVFGVMFYSMLMHRKSVGATPSKFHESTAMELAWTIVPAIILVLMAIPATKTLISIYDTSEADLDIKVVGYQWKWQYKYLDEDYNRTFSFFSNLATPRSQINNRQVKTDTYLLEVDRPLRIPANRKVRFLITAEDVIHA